ncbi:MAG: protein of unknown function hydrolase family protein, partial [Ramlibacter sp.]|nr:protein of unknown function hydrolase family protein [Ramlibacter sp.]
VYYGAKDVDEAERKINQMSLDGIAERIRCPLLVAHGARDQQVPLEQAERTVRSAVNSPRAELRLFDESEGGVEHCSGDLFSIAIDAMADWVADVFQMPR